MDYESIYPKVRIKILVPMLIGLAFSMQAQKYFDNNWLFGYGTGIPDTVNPFGGIIMSFTNNKVSFTLKQEILNLAGRQIVFLIHTEIYF